MSLMWKKSDPNSDKGNEVILGVNYKEIFSIDNFTSSYGTGKF